MHCFDGDESKSKQSGYVYGAVKGTGDAVYGTSGAHALKTQRENLKQNLKSAIGLR